MPRVPILLAHIRVFVIQVSVEMEPLAQVCVVFVFCLFLSVSLSTQVKIYTELTRNLTSNLPFYIELFRQG